METLTHCRACENVAGNPDPVHGDPAGLCWPCFAKYRPVTCAGCGDSIPAMYVTWLAEKPHCDGCAEDTEDSIRPLDPAGGDDWYD